MDWKDVNASSFGLLIAFLLPGMVALFALRYWTDSTARAFDTFLKAEANLGLFLFLLLGALTLGLVISTVRWLFYEVILMRSSRLYGARLTESERRRLRKPDLYAAHRQTVDQTYRYHQCFGALSVAAPLLFAGWIKELEESWALSTSKIAGLVALEALIIAASITALRSYFRYAKAILGENETTNPSVVGNTSERAA
jgi:hypothetical protein